MNLYQKILLVAYGILIIIFGFLHVPTYLVWGPEKNISTKMYEPVWKLVQEKHYINGFTPMYQIDYGRVLFIIGLFTLVTLVIYLILAEMNKTEKNI